MPAPILSAQGQWRWDEEQNDWIPNAGGGAGLQQPQQAVDPQQRFQSAAMIDMMQTGGKNLSKIKTLSEFVAPAKDEKELLKTTTGLRQEHRKETKDLGFRELQNSWNKVSKAPTTGAGDLTVVYSYIKALDPTTAVREGEINLTKAAESIPSNIIRAYKRAKEGKVISPELRQEMVTEIGRMYNNIARQQQEINTFYSGLAEQSGADPQDVIGAVGEISLAEIPQAPAPAAREGGLNIMKLLRGEQEAVREEGVGPTALRTMFPALQLGRPGGAGAALEVGAAIPLLSMLTGRGLGGMGVGAVEKARGVTPKAVFGRRQAAAAAETVGKVKPNTSKLMRVGEKLAKVDPDVSKQFVKHKGRIKNIKNIPQLLENMQVWGRGAYKTGGGIKATAKAELYNKLYQEGIGQLKDLAPEVYKNRQLLRYTFELPKAIGRGLWRATLGKALMMGL